MLIWKSKTAFENPSYRVFLDSGERFTNESTGESTPHAEKVATSYERMNLLDKVGKNLPDRTTLTMSEYTVESTDTKGVHEPPRAYARGFNLIQAALGPHLLLPVSECTFE